MFFRNLQILVTLKIYILFHCGISIDIGEFIFYYLLFSRQKEVYSTGKLVLRTYKM